MSITGDHTFMAKASHTLQQLFYGAHYEHMLLQKQVHDGSSTFPGHVRDETQL